MTSGEWWQSANASAIADRTKSPAAWRNVAQWRYAKRRAAGGGMKPRIEPNRSISGAMRAQAGVSRRADDRHGAIRVAKWRIDGAAGETSAIAREESRNEKSP